MLGNIQQAKVTMFSVIDMVLKRKNTLMLQVYVTSSSRQ
jgi:hypothetical protein